MDCGKKIVANLIDAEESRIAVLDKNGKLCDFFAQYQIDSSETGEIYKAKVENVLPGMHAAFLNLGDGHNGFLYLKDAQNIEVTAGADMLVQVVKNARKGKCARISPKISLAGRYLVLAPGERMCGVSKQIAGDAERERLYAILRRYRPDGFGLIARTAANGVHEEAIISDIQELLSLWEKIQTSAKELPAPSCVHKEAKLLDRILRDELTDDIDEIVVDTEEDYSRIKEYVGKLSDRNIEVAYYSGNMPIFELYNIESQLSELQQKRVWLKSGAYLVIDQTEALTAIDVNTGKFTGSKNLDDTVVATNIEAAKEIARQLRLRAIGGIVIVDFIDMATSADNQKLIEELREQFKGDRAKPKVHGITDLGLVEITRKRARTDFNTQMLRSCPFCAGHGVLEKQETVAMQIKRFVRKISSNSNSQAVVIECRDDIAKFIFDTVLLQWQEEFKAEIVLLGSCCFARSKYRADFCGTKDELREKLRLYEEEGRENVYRAPSA